MQTCLLNNVFQSIGFGEKEKKETSKEAGIFSSHQCNSYGWVRQTTSDAVRVERKS